MYICCKCRREMPCDKNSVGADFGNGHVYPADRYKCPECGDAILATVTIIAYSDHDYNLQDEYLKIIQEPVL